MSFFKHLLPVFALFSELSNAQVSSAFNPVANPGCSTVASIVASCGPKLGTAATVSSAAFSCICFDDSGNYAPTIYGNAATACTNYIISALSTTGNAFVQYAAGFCTDPSFVPEKTTPLSTTPTATGVGAGGSNTAPAQTTSTTPTTVLPGGNISTSSSTSTISGSESSATNAPPAATKASSSSSGFSSASISAGSGSSTTSKAEGAKMATPVRDGSLWSVFGSLIMAIFIL